MAKKRKPKMEFRYYKMPTGSPVMALLGDKWKQTYGDNTECMHFHNYMEIGYCHSGQGFLKMDEEKIRFEGGEFTVIPKNFPHSTNSDPETMSYWEYLFVDVDEVFCRIYQNNPKRAERVIQRVNSWAIVKKSEENPVVAARINEIFEVMRKKDEFYLEEVNALLEALMIEVVRMSPSEDERKIESHGKTTIAVARIVDYINEHYMEPLRIEELAELYHFSETHFRRVFSEYMNMSPLEYINLVRVEEACEYLKTTDKSITEIAQLCGFVTNSTFNRNFTRVMNVSPGQWRKRPENYEQQLLKYTIHSEEGW